MIPMITTISKIFHRIIALKRKRYMNLLIKRGLSIGDNVEIVGDYFFDPSHCNLIEIGHNCTICPNVRLIAHDASTKKICGYTKIGKICIGENCFIGDSSIILPNVNIGENTIIGAGSVVTRSMPKDVIVAGNPAKVISDRNSYINKIKKLYANTQKFDMSFHINNITDDKVVKLKESTKSSISFIE